MSSNNPYEPPAQRPSNPRQGSSYFRDQKVVNFSELGLVPRKAAERPTVRRSKLSLFPLQDVPKHFFSKVSIFGFDGKLHALTIVSETFQTSHPKQLPVHNTLPRNPISRLRDPSSITRHPISQSVPYVTNPIIKTFTQTARQQRRPKGSRPSWVASLPSKQTEL